MPDLTPTERAVTNLRALRAAGYSQDNDTGLLLADYDGLEASEQQFRLTAAVDAKQISELEAELATANARLTAVLDACTAADQQYPTTGSPRDPVIHISTVRRAAGHEAGVTA
jgi:hypothetical protein